MFKKSVVIKPKKMNIPRFDYKNLVFVSLFVSGLIIGLMIIKKDIGLITEIINPIFKNIIIEKNNTSFFECFINTTSLFLFIPIAVFSLGLCATGVPIIILIPAIGGIISGLYVGYLYATYAMQGLGYAALIIIPAAAIIIGTLLKCCVESIFMSLEIIVSITSKAKNNSNRNELKEYCLKFLVFLIPFVLAGLINTTCFKLFGSLFSFVT